MAFAAVGPPSTTATFSALGTYVLRLTATDGVLSAWDECRSPPYGLGIRIAARLAGHG